MIGHRPLLTPFEDIDTIGDLGRPIHDVLTLVSPVGDLLAATSRLERGHEQLHLGATIVEVVLAFDHMTATLEDAGQRIAVGGATTVTGMERSGRVGAHEFEEDPRPRSRIGSSEAVDSGGEYRSGDLVQPRVGQPEVHETGTGHLHCGDMRGRVGLENGGDPTGQFPWVPAGGLRHRQGHIRGPIPVFAPGRPLEVDLGGQRLDLERREGRAQGTGELIADHGRSAPVGFVSGGIVAPYLPTSPAPGLSSPSIGSS